MEMTVQDYAKKLEAGDFTTSEDTITGTKVQQKSVISVAIKDILGHLSNGELARQNWTVKVRSGEAISIRLECNLINIPMDEALRLDGKLLDSEKQYPVNIYLVAESSDLNRTGLRIDSLVDGPKGDEDASALAAKAQVWIVEKLGLIAQNRKEAKEEAAKAKKKKSTTKKKSTSRKTSKSTK